MRERVCERERESVCVFERERESVCVCLRERERREVKVARTGVQVLPFQVCPAVSQ